MQHDESPYRNLHVNPESDGKTPSYGKALGYSLAVWGLLHATLYGMTYSLHRLEPSFDSHIPQAHSIAQVFMGIEFAATPPANKWNWVLLSFMFGASGGYAVNGSFDDAVLYGLSAVMFLGFLRALLHLREEHMPDVDED